MSLAIGISAICIAILGAWAIFFCIEFAKRINEEDYP